MGYDINDYDEHKIYRGRVIFYYLYRGFGFIKIFATNAEIYVNRKDIISPKRQFKSLKDNEIVEFKVKVCSKTDKLSVI